jgi:GMP synthase-like glutamine amidotransferase
MTNSPIRLYLIQHVPFEGAGYIQQWLDNQGLAYTWIRLSEDPVFPPIDTVGGLVILGGPMSVTDTEVYPWIGQEVKFIQEVIEQNLPVLGVCLGAQFIAKAMGARVYKNHSKEIGWFPIRWLETDFLELGTTVPNEMIVFHWHSETFELPTSAVWLATNDACRHQAFRVGAKIIGLQFHLEIDQCGMNGLIEHCANDLDDSGGCQSVREIRSGFVKNSYSYTLLENILQQLFGSNQRSN